MKLTTNTKPLSIRALSADAELLGELEPPSYGTAVIHSVFERVVNLELGHGRLVTLAYSGSDEAPDTVVVDVPGWCGFGLQTAGAAQYADGLIMLGDVAAITLDHAHPWHCRLPSFAADRNLLRSNLSLAQDFLEQRGKGIALQASAENASAKKLTDDFDSGLIAIFQRAVQGLWLGLVQNDMHQAREYACQLVGLGPGLTPAGDDFLVGLMGALNIPGSTGYGLRQLGDTVVECALLRTHAISLASLRHAARGRVPARVIRLCEALIHDTPTNMLAKLEHLLQTGSSSGTDIAAGVLSGFALHLQLEQA
jgi:hypothetical protein